MIRWLVEFYTSFLDIECVLNSSLVKPELKTLEWDILNPDRLINLEINNKRRTSII